MACRVERCFRFVMICLTMMRSCCAMQRGKTLEEPESTHSVTVSYPDMPYLGIWHWPKKDAPYVCIEPWTSLPAKRGEITVFERQQDLIALEPGEVYRNSWSICIHA